MKKLILISALLFITTGCVTAFRPAIQASHHFEDYPRQFWGTIIIVDNYEDIDMTLAGDRTYKVEAMSISSGEKFFYAADIMNINYFSQRSQMHEKLALDTCRELFNSDCVITRKESAIAYGITTTYDEDIFYTNLDDYKEKEEQRLASYEKTRLQQQKWKEEAAERNARAEEQRLVYLEEERLYNEQLAREETLRREQEEKERREQEQKILAGLRDRCVSFGFTGDNNIAACIQREAQHDLEIEQQKYELRLAQQRLDEQYTQTRIAQQRLERQNTQTQLAQQRLERQSRQTQVVEEEVPWIIRFLGDVVVGVSEGYAQSSYDQKIRQEERSKYRRQELIKQVTKPRSD